MSKKFLKNSHTKQDHKVITRLLQLTVITSFLTLVLSHYPFKEQIIKYSVYFSFLFFSFSIYYNSNGNEFKIIRDFNLLNLNIFVYLILLTNDMRIFSYESMLSNRISYEGYAPWVDISIDYFQNLIIFIILLAAATLYILFSFKSFRNKNHLIRLIGINMIMICILFICFRFINLFENVF
jgi:hypothetical protein